MQSRNIDISLAIFESPPLKYRKSKMKIMMKTTNLLCKLYTEQAVHTHTYYIRRHCSRWRDGGCIGVRATHWHRNSNFHLFFFFIFIYKRAVNMPRSTFQMNVMLGGFYLFFDVFFFLALNAI